PDIGITADVIVGFPGETGGEFEEGFRFIDTMGFSAMHVFPYSRRPGTSAALLPGQVGPLEKRARERRMLDLAQRTAHRRRQQMVGRPATVLWEERKPVDGGPAWTGLTEHYVRVYVRSDDDLDNRLLPVTLTGVAPNGLWCELASHKAESLAAPPATLSPRR
ncbi:MAG: hypothetical protein V3V35_11840, partial [Dehalococcoidia bacterium]